jgi:hypothetical protein
VFEVSDTGIEVNGSYLTSITGNAFNATSGNPAVTHLKIANSSLLNTAINNVFDGVTTNDIAIDATSAVNTVYPNTINTGATGTPLSNLGVHNVVTGIGGHEAPGISGCSATIGTNSLNSAGFITSGTTGTCTVTLTFNLARMGSPGTGWSCSISNQTTANLIRQSGNTTTTVTFSGTTVTGDVLVYACTGY